MTETKNFTDETIHIPAIKHNIVRFSMCRKHWPKMPICLGAIVGFKEGDGEIRLVRVTEAQEFERHWEYCGVPVKRNLTQPG